MNILQYLADGTVAFGVSFAFGLAVRATTKGHDAVADSIASLPKDTPLERLAVIGITAVHGLPVLYGMMALGA